ncbi:1-phosphatidylinositol-3-phosphate 5-kinase FAB1A [Thalictrum thalictroides]|uniref:1-phosphatidylinositol-3-phosphate 5-kinase n=1 Tax=Thalictrum thalictroides TaxID=46969 RepID=A0A7J6VQM1_THATH|nr:1-phosphatidylinositol-3-phosphate 5-kinase FAB1A [Thalictrum thalictroides]
MGTPDKKLSELVDIVKSWIPRRTEPASLSRNFWMPDESCIVCYECDSQFTIFNRRHHCRLCGRIFCAKCTTNSIPIPSDEPKPYRGERERIRVCNYCFKLWEKEIATHKDGSRISSQGPSPSPSATSLASLNSSGTGQSCNNIVGSGPISIGSYQSVPHTSGPGQSAQMEPSANMQEVVGSGRNVDIAEDIGDPSPNPFEYCMNRSDEDDDDDDEYSTYHSDSEKRDFRQPDYYYDQVEFDESDQLYKVHPDDVTIEISSSSLAHDNIKPDADQENTKLEEVVEQHNRNDCEAVPSLYTDENTEPESVDFENNGLLWLPPEPEDVEDEREPVLFEDDDEDGGVTGEWGYLRSSSSFGSGEYRNRDRSNEEHKQAVKNVVDGHFRALVAQLLQVENLPVGDEDDNENWLEIITWLSWEAATLLKPDTSKSGGMDPGGYVKIKCLASGRRSASAVVKGVVCRKNVAHRRMTSKIDKPRFLILGGALEYQRVTNLLSSFDTLLQQEMDHLKMAVAKIDAHKPNILLVEKSVSRFAQEYLLAKDISLVLNIKRPLLERIARCTGAQILPSIDHLSSQKLGYCDTFHVEKFLEEHGSAGQEGKKLVKTLMFFEGCPKPLGCTILLKGAIGDELKKVKHVLQYGVFAAYHLALETSFLADEGASLPELPLKSPITVALPDKPSSMDRSISVIPGFTVASTGKPQWPQPQSELHRPNKILTPEAKPPTDNPCENKFEKNVVSSFLQGLSPQFSGSASTFSKSSASNLSLSPQRNYVGGSSDEKISTNLHSGEKHYVEFGDSLETKPTDNISQSIAVGRFASNGFVASMDFGQNGVNTKDIHIESSNSEMPSLQHDSNKYNVVHGSSKEEFPPSPSNHQSILVSLSTRCVWKGTVCERSHLFRIKYYGSFDKPLGRFLRDHLFEKSYCCRSCEMPSEAHVHCYTHRQGSLTISVKKLPEFLLPGEREGKIWMWHRCLRCPRKNGFPPATRRVVMSDAAWGLSFGKFLELSFSNHAAASRVASCGHSLHRDCLRFYGFGKMVACFRYASIDVHSVYLPPAQLEFNYKNHEWIQNEANEVVDWIELLFTEVLNALHQIAEKKSGIGPSKVAELRRHIAELEGMLQKEKAEYEESLHKALNRELNRGQLVIDILEINRLRRQLLLHSYMWDHRLVNAANLDRNSVQGTSSSMQFIEKAISSIEKTMEMDSTSVQSSVFSSGDSVHMDGKLKEPPNPGGKCHQNNQFHQVVDHNQKQTEECWPHVSRSTSPGGQIDPLDSGVVVRRAISEGQFPIVANISDTLDAAWTGENISGSITPIENASAFSSALISSMPSTLEAAMQKLVLEEHLENRGTIEGTRSLGSALPVKVSDNLEDSTGWTGMPFRTFYHTFNKNSSGNISAFDSLGDYNPIYVSSLRELERQSRARLLFPVGVNDTVVPIYDEEPTSIISYTLLSPDYHAQVVDERDRPKEGDSVVSLPLHDSSNVHLPYFIDGTTSESLRSLGSLDDSILSMSGSRTSLDPLSYTKGLHVRVSFTGDGPLGKVKHTVICYYAKGFEALRKICCPSELDFIRSLARCKKWGAQGGKSNVFFAKSMDERFIIKQVTKTELESFIKFAPEYFKYLSESIRSKSPTCLAKILGIYQVTSKHLKGGKESRMDVLVMENLLFGRKLARLYDLKGSSRSRYNSDSSGTNKVLLDQNLIEAMPTSPIFVGNKAKRLLERAVWNDTLFLASIDVMDYSLLVGVDEEKHELVLGIIDFMRQYTWDKHLETWVKASGILGGPKNTSPTVISPKQYKKRFRKAMSTYFLMVPDQWSPPSIIPSRSQSELCEE